MWSGPRRFRNTATRRWLRQFSRAEKTRPRKRPAEFTKEPPSSPPFGPYMGLKGGFDA